MNTGTLKWTGPQQSRLPSLDTDRRRDFVPKRRAAADEKVSYTDAKRKLTGDGDIMMRFLPCYQAVESLRRGMTPREAAEDAVRRMVRRYPDVASGVVVTDAKGNHAGAGSGWTFTYSIRGGDMAASEVFTIPPLKAEVDESLGADALPEWLPEL